MLIGLLVGVVGLLLASILDDIGAGITVEVIEAVAPIPDPVLVIFILAVQLIAWLVPILTVATLLWRRTYRRLLLVVLAVLVAAGAAWGLEQAVLDSFAVDVIAVEIPSWICDSQEALARTGLDDPSDVGSIVGSDVVGQSLRGDACVPGDGFPSTVYIAGLTAGFSVLAPWLNRRWRRFAWVLIAVFLLVRTIDGIVVPIDGVLVVALGYAIGAGTVLLFGAPDRRPKGEDIVAALGRHGVQLSELSEADIPARNSTPWFATTTDGDRLFVKVVGPEERAADVLYRSWRAVRLKGVGDSPPFLTVRRKVEHEAAVALAAWAGGVRTPKLVAAGDVGINSMLLAYEAVVGRSLDTIETVSVNTIPAVWEQVAVLHDRRIAHRNLSLGNVVVAEDGDIWLTGFGFAELAADDAQLSTDVAQLLAATSVQIGPERAVAAAAQVLEPEAFEGAAPRLQPAALGSSTSAALKEHKGLLTDLQDEVRAEAGIEKIELEKLERINLRAVITALMLGLAFYFLIPQLADVSLDDIREADWGWFPLIILFSFLTYVGATINMMGSVPDRLGAMSTMEAQIGASFVNRISPVKVGGMATNLRYLQKSGVDSPVAVAGIGVSNVVGFIVHMTLLVVFVTTAGRSAAETISLPTGQAVLVGLVVVMTLAGAVLLVPYGRRLVLDRLWPIIKKSVVGIGNVATRPSKVLALFGGSFLITTSYILALWYSIQAFGGDISFVRVGAVYLAGQALAQAAPTPGGIGAAEAALIAGLTAFGLDAEVAVPAVFLYRFATFWLPVLPGWIAVRHLLRVGAL